VKTCSTCKESKSFELFPKHKRMKDGLSTICSACNKVVCREKYLANKDKYKAAATAWKAANKERYLEATRVSAPARYKADPERHLAYGATYRAKHKEKLLGQWREDAVQRRAENPEHARALARAWAKSNREKVAVGEARRRAAKIGATTNWDAEFDALVLAEAFAVRAARSVITGFEWHVDHVVPLQGETVCGLHNAYNVAVIPAAENVRKRHVLWPDMPC